MSEREAQHIAALEIQVATLEHTLAKVREEYRALKRERRTVAAMSDLLAALRRVTELLEDW